MAKGRRGRKPKAESLLAVRIRQRLECAPARMAVIRPPVLSISDLERHLNLPTDALRDICRGRTGRNKVHKVGILAKVASALDFPLDELASLAGITMLNGKKIDFGTTEVINKRTDLAKGGDPRLCGTALGTLRSHGDVPGQLGISEGMFAAGERFGRLAAMTFSSAGGNKMTPLAKAVYEGDPPPPPPTEARITYCSAAYRGAWNALMRSDLEASKSVFGIGRPSVGVWSVVFANQLPLFACFDISILRDPDLTEDEKEKLIAESRPGVMSAWLSLRVGLRALAGYFSSPSHISLWRTFQDEEELERLGFDRVDEVCSTLVTEAERQLGRKGLVII